MIKKWKNGKKSCEEHGEWNVSISALKLMDIIFNTYCKYRLVVRYNML
jgi:hypothetical protein